MKRFVGLLCLLNVLSAQEIVSPTGTKIIDHGQFDNLKMYEYAGASIGNIDVTAEYSSYVQGRRHYATNAVSGAISVPPDSLQYGSNAVAGYATSSSSVTNVDAGYFQCRVVGNAGKCWGINPVAIDTSGLRSGITLINEFDVQPQNKIGAYSSINGLLMNFFAPAEPNGTVFSNAFAFLCAKGQPGGIWQVCYSTSDGASGTFAQIGSVGVKANSNSQAINANIRDSDNRIRELSLFGDNSGSWTLNSYDGRLILDRNGRQAAIIDAAANSRARIYKTPDASGTVVLDTANQTLSKKRLASPVVNDGIAPDGSGLKHKRILTGDIGARTRMEVFLTWNTPFGDSKYTVTCSVEDLETPADTQGLIYERVHTHSRFQVGAVLTNPTSNSLAGTLDCIGIHELVN